MDCTIENAIVQYQVLRMMQSIMVSPRSCEYYNSLTETHFSLPMTTHKLIYQITFNSQKESLAKPEIQFSCYYSFDCLKANFGLCVEEEPDTPDAIANDFD